MSCMVKILKVKKSTCTRDMMELTNNGELSMLKEKTMLGKRMPMERAKRMMERAKRMMERAKRMIIKTITERKAKNVQVIKSLPKMEIAKLVQMEKNQTQMVHLVLRLEARAIVEKIQSFIKTDLAVIVQLVKQQTKRVQLV